MPDHQRPGGPADLDPSPRTQPFMPADGTAPVTGRRDHDATQEQLLHDPVAAMREPDNRSKLWLATAAATLLNTLLLIAVLANVAGDDQPEPVMVEGQPCLVVEGPEAAQLFCQR